MAKQGDAFLFAGVDKEGGPLNKAPRISYLAEIVVLQALSIALQNEENIDLQDYKKWHQAEPWENQLNRTIYNKKKRGVRQ